MVKNRSIPILELWQFFFCDLPESLWNGPPSCIMCMSLDIGSIINPPLGSIIPGPPREFDSCKTQQVQTVSGIQKSIYVFIAPDPSFGISEVSEVLFITHIRFCVFSTVDLQTSQNSWWITRFSTVQDRYILYFLTPGNKKEFLGVNFICSLSV